VIKRGKKGCRELRSLHDPLIMKQIAVSLAVTMSRGGLQVIIYEAQVAIMECKRVE
jgi:hypothetical protein